MEKRSKNGGISKSQSMEEKMKKKTESSSNQSSSMSDRQGVKNEAAVSRPCKEHSFLTDVADVRAMEQGLLQLLQDFHSGKLQAFGDVTTFEKMDQIREQQEKLARLHFELDLQQDIHRHDSDEARKTANENLSKLIDQLESVSTSIQDLQKYEHSS